MTAIILCSRLESNRVPNKCMLRYNGITHIEHLIKRLLASDYPIYVAVPEEQIKEYAFLMHNYPGRVFISGGYGDDPLKRMYKCAEQNNIDTIVRVTHDKIFVNTDIMKEMVEQKIKMDAEYVYSSNFTPGTGCEVIAIAALKLAAEKYKKVEHISYAIKSVTGRIYNHEFISDEDPVRLLVDFPEDVKLMDVLFTTLGSDCTLQDVLQFMAENRWLRNMNALPLVTIYTCAYNAEKWINEAMGSVSFQNKFTSNIEYILIDDCSTDKTLFHMAKFCERYKNSRFYKNTKNEGLATSSNRALKLAKGKYIMRLDADDYFISKFVIDEMINKLELGGFDAVYPDCFTTVGLDTSKTQKGRDTHHVGSALFSTAALNYIKFTDKLRGFDSLDVYLRAKDTLNLGYLDKPTFLYRQHKGSLSKNNLEERAKIKQSLEVQHESRA